MGMAMVSHLYNQLNHQSWHLPRQASDALINLKLDFKELVKCYNLQFIFVLKTKNLSNCKNFKIH